MQYPTYNGVPAAELLDVSWQKSHRSNSQGNCVELAKLPDGSVAVRNSRHPTGPALVYTKGEMQALIQGAKAGDFDSLLV
jgi:NADH:ubiquinone oxidoreductase subunit